MTTPPAPRGRRTGPVHRAHLARPRCHRCGGVLRDGQISPHDACRQPSAGSTRAHVTLTLAPEDVALLEAAGAGSRAILLRAALDLGWRASSLAELRELAGELSRSPGVQRLGARLDLAQLDRLDRIGPSRSAAARALIRAGAPRK